MKTRYALVGAILVVALVLTVNTYALTQATVRSATGVSVTSTDAALLALSENHFMSSIVGGKLQIDFRVGNGGTGSYQLRGNTTYPDNFRMYDLFRVTNNSDDRQCVQVKVNGSAPAHLQGIYGRLSGTNPAAPPAAPGTLVSGANSFSLNAGQTMVVDFVWNAANGTSSVPAAAFALQVTGQRLVTCP